jgi:hypothetical protein
MFTADIYPAHPQFVTERSSVLAPALVVTDETGAGNSPNASLQGFFSSTLIDSRPDEKRLVAG